jgi:hypothetical protein
MPLNKGEAYCVIKRIKPGRGRVVSRHRKPTPARARVRSLNQKHGEGTHLFSVCYTKRGKTVSIDWAPFR